MKRFVVNWYKKEKYFEPIKRKNTVTADNVDAAISVFSRTFGNATHNVIESIQEVDMTSNENIGEPITEFVY